MFERRRDKANLKFTQKGYDLNSVKVCSVGAGFTPARKTRRPTKRTPNAIQPNPHGRG
jgi:hypothetical protein